MKKVIFLGLAAIAVYFTFCYTALSESRVIAFLDRFEDDINKGNPAAACDKLNDTVFFSIYDKTKFPPQRISGDKRDLCNYFNEASLHYATAMIADRHYRADFSIDRGPKSGSLAAVSYTEHHEIEFFPSHEKVRTISTEKITLKRVGTGLKVTEWIGETKTE